MGMTAVFEEPVSVGGDRDDDPDPIALSKEALANVATECCSE